MSDTAEIKAKFWKALKSERTFMLGLADEHAQMQPRTAQIEDEAGGPIWVFTSKETDLVQALGQGADATASFTAKGHDLFAAFEGRLTPHNDRQTVDRLWNPFVAAWFEGGKEDPKLQLLRFDAEEGRVWLNESSLLAGVKILLGSDPKKDYKDKVADVRL